MGGLTPAAPPTPDEDWGGFGGPTTTRGLNGRPLKPGGLHYINGSHHTGAWLILPLLSWWHTALSLFPTRWSNGSCTDLGLPGRHIGMDQRTSPTAQLGKDWASCLPCHSNSTAWLPDSVRFINNYTINFGQKSWCNLWWPADLQRAFCKDCSILQVCTTQNQKDQALSDRACCTTSCPGPCHF